MSGGLSAALECIYMVFLICAGLFTVGYSLMLGLGFHYGNDSVAGAGLIGLIFALGLLLLMLAYYIAARCFNKIMEKSTERIVCWVFTGIMATLLVLGIGLTIAGSLNNNDFMLGAGICMIPHSLLAGLLAGLIGVLITGEPDSPAAK